MATSRCRGATALTKRSPKLTVPEVISSRPATIRSAVVLPQPDGPTSTTNSPSATSRSGESSPFTPGAQPCGSPLSVMPATRKPPLVRDAAEQHAAAPVPLQDQEQDDERGDGDQAAHHDQRVQVLVSAVGGVLRPQPHPDRQREQVVVAEDDQRQEVVVPHPDPREQQHGHQARD